MRHVLLCLAAGGLLAPLGCAAGEAERPPGISFRLFVQAVGESLLEIANTNQKFATIGLNIWDSDRGRFEGLPDVAFFQLRDIRGKSLACASLGSGWFNPSILNSVINQPVFRSRNEPQGTPPPELLYPFRLDAGGSKVILFDVGQVLDIVRNLAHGEARDFRVRLDVEAKVDGKKYAVPLTSDWLPVPPKPRAKPPAKRRGE